MSDDRLADKPMYENNDLMRYPRLDADRALREKALEMALSILLTVPSVTGKWTTEDVINTAQDFEAYLRGDDAAKVDDPARPNGLE